MERFLKNVGQKVDGQASGGEQKWGQADNHVDEELSCTSDGGLSDCCTDGEQDDKVQVVKMGDCLVDEQTSGGGQGWGQADNQVRCTSDGGLSD
jgi:hypothetical protein